LNKVVDAELTNFEDLVRDVVDKYPPDFGELDYFISAIRTNGGCFAPAFTKEEDMIEEEAYTKKTFNCASLPSQPSF